MNEYTFITDGAYSSARDQGGAAVVILHNGEYLTSFNKGFKRTTNNQMEMIAVILSLLCIKKPVDKITIISDSMYVIGCATLNWKRKKNVKLWSKFDAIYNNAKKFCNNIEFQHIKGHSGNIWNELADDLAVQASKELLGEE